MDRIAIVIPSHNNALCLKDCVDSILNKFKEHSFIVVISDNASQESATRRLLVSIVKDEVIQVIRNDRNIGYGGAINVGLSFLEEHEINYKYVLILNQDTKLLNNIHKPIKAMLDSNSRVGICGPRLYNPDGTLQVSFYDFHSWSSKMAMLLGFRRLGGLFSRLGISTFLSSFLPCFAKIHLKNFEELENPVDVPWIKGACLAVRKEVFQDIGQFDPGFVMYGEDMDFCKRASNNGWNIYHIPYAHVLHHGGRRPSERSLEMVTLYYDSLSYYYAKHFHGTEKRLMTLLNPLERWKEKNVVKHSKQTERTKLRSS